MNMNLFAGCGRLVRAPEVRQVGESAVANYTLAINDTYVKKDGERLEDTLFLDIETWGEKQAKLIGDRCQKGTEMIVTGTLKLDRWEDKDGNKRQRIKLRTKYFNIGVNSIRTEEYAGAGADEGKGTDAVGDDIPF